MQLRSCLLILFLVPALLPAQDAHTIHAATLHRTWSAQSGSVGSLAIGIDVTTLSHRNGYTHVQTADGTKGWAYSRYLAQGVAAGQPPGAPVTPAVPPLNEIGGLPKPAPEEAHLAACQDVGRSTTTQRLDSATNLLKNRVDTATYQPVAFASVLALPWQGMDTRRYLWDTNERTRTAVYEGVAISVSGFIVDVDPESAEATNCGKATDDWVDWHMWLVETAAEATAKNKRNSIVVEITPRVRMKFPGRLDLDSIRRWRSSGQKVVVSGWLMLDPDHPSNALGTATHPPSRGTIWEIHPVMNIVPAQP